MADRTRRVRVLVADADPLARLALREALSASSALEIVCEVADGASAIRKAEDEHPDILLIDSELAGEDPRAELEAILHAAPSTAVVIMSTVADEESGIGALEAGACGYLSKATDPATFPRVVAGVARGEAAISRRLTKRVVERLWDLPASGYGIRPVRSELTRREWEVIDLMRRQEDETEIAAQLGITPGAVRRYQRGLCTKLGASSVEEIVTIAGRLCQQAVLGDAAPA